MALHLAQGWPETVGGRGAKCLRAIEHTSLRPNTYRERGRSREKYKYIHILNHLLWDKSGFVDLYFEVTWKVLFHVISQNTHTHTHTHTYTHTHTHTQTHIYIYIYITRIQSSTDSYIRYKRKNETHSYICTYILNVHIYMTHLHTYTNTFIHTRNTQHETFSLSLSLSLFLSLSFSLSLSPLHTHTRTNKQTKYKALLMPWLSSLEMDIVTQVQILNEAVCILHSANNLSKSMIQLFSLHIWVNSRAECAFKTYYGNQSQRKKSEAHTYTHTHTHTYIYIYTC